MCLEGVDDVSHTLGQLIRERRQEMGITQEQVAELIGEGLRQSEVLRLERGHVT